MRVYYFKKLSTNKLILSSNTRLVYEHKPSIAFINNYGVKVKYNSLGFIGDEIKPKEGNIIRILGVGDSITDATYLPEEQQYLNLSAPILMQRINKNINIVNAAVGGYNTWQDLEIIKDKGLSIKPDLIIVGICQNDYVMAQPSLRQVSANLIVQKQ